MGETIVQLKMVKGIVNVFGIKLIRYIPPVIIDNFQESQ